MPDALLSFLSSLRGALIGAATAVTVAARARKRQYKLEDRSEELLFRLLGHERFRLRTFATIKYHVAGFEDNELRKALIRAGALRFEDALGAETWGLLDRNEHLLQNEVGTRDD